MHQIPSSICPLGSSLPPLLFLGTVQICHHQVLSVREASGKMLIYSFRFAVAYLLMNKSHSVKNLSFPVTWKHMNRTFPHICQRVLHQNQGLSLFSDVTARYTFPYVISLSQPQLCSQKNMPKNLHKAQRRRLDSVSVRSQVLSLPFRGLSQRILPWYLNIYLSNCIAVMPDFISHVYD